MEVQAGQADQQQPVLRQNSRQMRSGVTSGNVHEHPLFAKSSIHDSMKVKIAPVYSDFARDFESLSLMGFTD